MKRNLSRRDFVKSSLLASAAIPLSLRAQPGAEAPAAPAGGRSETQTLPQGRIGNVELSRLIMGGNLIAGWAHARDLPYVSTLMRQVQHPRENPADARAGRAERHHRDQLLGDGR